MRKNVVRIHVRHMRTNPRIGQDIREYYRNVTHLAKDHISPDIDEAWQFITSAYEEDSEKYINDKLRKELGYMVDDGIDPNEDVIVYRRGKKWFRYVDWSTEETTPLEFE